MDLFIQIFIGVLFFVIGTVFASFSNVLIYRLPLEQSIAYPASHCPQCGAELKWYENIPLFSYIFLKVNVVIAIKKYLRDILLLNC